MSFDLADYVDVAERIRIFREKHPTGSLQSEVTIYQNKDGFIIGVLCKASAYRNTDDQFPGNGHSYLGVPGKTPYTKDSEVENAETSAWGRAIVAALAADTKKVASSNEVLAKQVSSSAGTLGGTGGQAAVTEHIPAASPAAPTSSDGWTWPFGKHKGKTLAETDDGYLTWFLANSDKEDIKARVTEFINLRDLDAFADFTGPDSDIPFDRTIDGLGG